MSYDPRSFDAGPSTIFFLHYNSTAQSVSGNADVVMQLDSLAHGGASGTDANYEITHLGVPLGAGRTLVARADAVMTPTQSTATNVFGSLLSDGNPTLAGNPVAALHSYQDHPARTTYHTGLTDEVLHMQGTGSMNVRFKSATTYAHLGVNFTVAAGKLVVGGFVR